VTADWHGRCALITGASSGIGAAVARVLAGRGATVGLVARRADRLAEVLADCQATGPSAAASPAPSAMWVADLADPDAPDRVAEAALAAWGRVDVLINNAATPGVRDVTRLQAAEVEHVMRVNFHAPVRLTLALLPAMLERGAGTVVNVSSLGGRLGIPREAAYCASKFALCGWSESLALDLWHTPVNVRLIVPGAVDTEIWDRPGEEPSTYDGPKVPAAEVAEGIADAVDAGGFEHYLPDMSEVVRFKTASIDDFFAGSIAYLTPDA
jgi:short-subunit dehydrogenase